MAESGAPALADGPLRFLPKAILEPRRPLRAIVIGWLTAAVPALLLAVAAQHLLPQVEGPKFDLAGWPALFALVVFAPVLETLIMAAVLAVLLRVMPPAGTIMLSAAGWAIAHALAAPAWGLVIWWPFLIFSTVYVVWRSRGFLTGVGMAAAVHGMNNLLPALAVAFGRALS